MNRIVAHGQGQGPKAPTAGCIQVDPGEKPRNSVGVDVLPQASRHNRFLKLFTEGGVYVTKINSIYDAPMAGSFSDERWLGCLRTDEFAANTVDHPS